MNKKKLKAATILGIFGFLAITNLFSLYYSHLNVIEGINNVTNPRTSGIVNRIVFLDDFESGLSNWSSITGLWHMTNSNSSYSDPYHSYEHSMWFGNESTGDYDTGFQETGNLTSIPFDLSSVYQASLEFYHWRTSEEGYDKSCIYISIDGNSWDVLYENYTNIIPWERKVLSISSYCGNSSVQIRFYFDTTDTVANNYRGWLVDDVLISGLEDDSTDPVITNSSSDFNVESGYSGQNISWTATDLNPFNYTIELQGEGTVVGPTAWISNNTITYNIPDGFGVGD